MMRRRPQHRRQSAALAAFAALMLWCGAALGQSLPEARQTWEQSQTSVQQAQRGLERSLVAYQKSVERLEKLKREEASGQASRRQLESALRESHVLVEGVREHQIAMLTREAELERARQALVNAIASERVALERRVATTTGAQQSAIIEELNRLSRLQAQVSDVARGVDPQRVERVMAEARMVQGGHPRDLLAVADELEDTEAQLRDRLSAVEARLAELERSQQLMRRARDFSTRERFFEENDRARQIARQEGGRNSDPENETPTRGDGDFASAPEVDDAADPSPPPEGAPVDVDSSQGDPNVGDHGSGESPDEPQPSPGAGFEPTDERVLIESLVDPQRMGEDAPTLSEGQTERGVRALRQERRALEAQVEELRERARELREEADEAWR